MVYRVYVEKKPELAKEASDLLHEARELLQIENLTEKSPHQAGPVGHGHGVDLFQSDSRLL